MKMKVIAAAFWILEAVLVLLGVLDIVLACGEAELLFVGAMAIVFAVVLAVGFIRNGKG